MNTTTCRPASSRKSSRIRFAGFVACFALLAAFANPPRATAANSTPITVGYYPNWVNLPAAGSTAATTASNPSTLKTLYESGALSNLNYLIYAFAYVDANGNCSIASGDQANAVTRQYTAAESVDGIADSNDPNQLHGDLNQLLKLKNLMKLQGKTLKILISVGGSNYGAGTSYNTQGQPTTNPTTFSNAAAHYSNFASTCINTFIAGNYSNSGLSSSAPAYPGIFDGFDIDWEYPNPSITANNDVANYVNLLQAFNTQLSTYSTSHNLSHLMLTSAISPEYELSLYSIYSFPQTQTLVDFYNFMGYDYASSGSINSNASLPDLQYDLQFLLQPQGNATTAVLPGNKLVLGLPFYGVSYTGATHAPSSYNPLTNAVGTLTAQYGAAVTTPYWQIAQTLNADGVYSSSWQFDSSTETTNGPSNTWGAWAYDSKAATLWNFDDALAIQKKAAYVSANGLAGMMAWDLSQDTATSSLTCTMEQYATGGVSSPCVPPLSTNQIVPITFTSSTAGVTFTINGTDCPSGTYSSPVTVDWSTLNGCTVQASTPSGERFYSWSDGNASNPRVFTPQLSAATYSAEFDSTTCSFTLSATSKTLATAASSGSVAVTTTSTCGWDAINEAPWITITSGGSGTGNGTVNFEASANTGTASRTGVLIIAGQTVTVTQPASTANANLIFAPHVDMSLPVDDELLSMQQQASLKAVTLAFVVGNPNSCSVSWAGLGTNLNDDMLSDGTSIQTLVQDLHNNNVQVIIAFGGASGSDPAVTCTNASQLEQLYESVISRYNVTMIDIDIEAAALTNVPAMIRRDQALRALKAANSKLVVSYTLPVAESGLTSSGLSLIQQAHTDGLNLDTLNIMTMDYGPAVTNMGQAAVSAAQEVTAQLSNSGMSSTTLGIIPMIGVNDSPGETFTVANAQTVLNFANANKNVARLGMWSLARDNGTCAGAATASPSCSGISQSAYAFSGVFNQIQ